MTVVNLIMEILSIFSSDSHTGKKYDPQYAKNINFLHRYHFLKFYTIIRLEICKVLDIHFKGNALLLEKLMKYVPFIFLLFNRISNVNKNSLT